MTVESDMRLPSYRRGTRALKRGQCLPSVSSLPTLAFLGLLMFLHTYPLILHTSIHAHHEKIVSHPPLESWLWEQNRKVPLPVLCSFPHKLLLMFLLLSIALPNYGGWQNKIFDCWTIFLKIIEKHCLIGQTLALGPLANLNVTLSKTSLWACGQAL